jgi:hypothetical protein
MFIVHNRSEMMFGGDLKMWLRVGADVDKIV